MKKINLKHVEFKKAPNRQIAELVSAEVLGSEQVTCRVVEVNPAELTEPRNPHFHLDMEEVIFVLEGEGEIWCEGSVEKIMEADLILIPAKERHMLINTTSDKLKLICFFPHNDMQSTQVTCKDSAYPEKIS